MHKKEEEEEASKQALKKTHLPQNMRRDALQIVFIESLYEFPGMFFWKKKSSIKMVVSRPHSFVGKL